MKPADSTLQVRPPKDLEFSDLKLRRYANGDISFDRQVASRVLQASGVPLARITEDLYGEVITAWYRIQRSAGGAADPIMDGMIAEDEEDQARTQTRSERDLL